MGNPIDEKTVAPAWVVWLALLVTGGGTSALFNAGTDRRPDPYTGAEGARDRQARLSTDAQLSRRISDIESKCERKCSDIRKEVDRVEDAIQDDTAASRACWNKLLELDYRLRNIENVTKRK